jgi:hypothetical protein
MLRKMLLILTLSLFSVGILALVCSGSELELRNDYIAILVNQESENTGRFSIHTTGGDPTRDDDDYQLLLYQQSQRSPWTSYTTVKIDEVDYVFGGPTKDQAGYNGVYGEMVTEPTIIEQNGQKVIYTSWQLGPALITQTLSFVRSSTTGLFDTVRIAYNIKNTDERPHQIGLRIMLDTMLGANDGAPFRVGELAILTDMAFMGSELSNFWQAFDSLSNPRVIGQGTLQGLGITTPDQVFFSNWGSLANGVWDFDFVPGRDFTRLGEFELDSAVALLWKPVTFQPGEEKQYVTHYGMGGISIVRGSLSLGITSPASVDSSRESSFPVVVYVQNTGEGEARNVEVSICVPAGLKVKGEACHTRPIGHLPVGRVAQVSWDVQLDGAVGGILAYTVQATAENLPEPVTATREIEILGPPKLSLSIDTPKDSIGGIYHPYNPPSAKVSATVANIGTNVAKDVILTVTPLPGINLSPVDRATRVVGELLPGEKKTVTWNLFLTGYSGRLSFNVVAVDKESGIPPTLVTGFVNTDFQSQALLQLPNKGSSEQPVTVGEIFQVNVMALNIRRLDVLEVELVYDPRQIALITGTPDLYGIIPGDLFILTDQEKAAYKINKDIAIPWEITLSERSDGMMSLLIQANRKDLNEFTGTPIAATGKVASLFFMALQPKESSIHINRFQVGEVSGVYEGTSPSISKTDVQIYIQP